MSMLLRHSVSAFTEPLLRSFLIRGVDTSPEALCSGAMTAYEHVMPRLIAKSKFAEDDDAPINALDYHLCSNVLRDHHTAIMMDERLPESSQAVHATLKHVNLILGAHRSDFDTSERDYRAGAVATVGSHLHVVVAESDLDPNGDLKRWQLYTSDCMKRLILKYGFAAQMAIEFKCEEVGSSIAMDDGGDDVKSGIKTSRTRRWLFETSIHGNFDSEPEWSVVDMDAVMDGNEFWRAAPQLSFSAEMKAGFSEYMRRPS